MSKESLPKSQIIFVYIIASFLQLCYAFQPSPCSSNISQEHRNLYSSIGAIDENMGSPRIIKQVYGTIGDTPIQKFTLTNKHRISVEVMEYGAILISCKTVNAEGKIEDLTLGFDTLDDWVNKNSHFFGASIGRFGNRIAHGKFAPGCGRKCGNLKCKEWKPISRRVFARKSQFEASFSMLSWTYAFMTQNIRIPLQTKFSKYGTTLIKMAPIIFR